MGDFFKDVFSGIKEVATAVTPLAQTYLQTDAAKDAAKATQQQQAATQQQTAQQRQTSTALDMNKVLLVVGGLVTFVMLGLGAVLIARRK
ncbi:hypothetical protein Ga0100231_023375 [Opitutaceae bacterium TAV4]|uniref:hypothetical protein n=1 Tax=Geminisphaera colitermitum TaxID=1148786 RepID=UPI000158CFF7|nr:hypothetical protein [Geminisphaera colitermitum]RRJ96728.1 hypothetical protein Ga0100231_023375 [Opitutaceae bacterium TAV4]RRK02416.1 hypothetical protein Ga0100230_004530 [Opitutaceae bacterium TAV3]